MGELIVSNIVEFICKNCGKKCIRNIYNSDTWKPNFCSKKCQSIFSRTKSGSIKSMKELKDKGYSLSQIGSCFGISGERVRQLLINL